MDHRYAYAFFTNPSITQLLSSDRPSIRCNKDTLINWTKLPWELLKCFINWNDKKMISSKSEELGAIE